MQSFAYKCVTTAAALTILLGAAASIDGCNHGGQSQVPAASKIKIVRPVLPPAGRRIAGPPMHRRPLSPRIILHDPLAIKALRLKQSRSRPKPVPSSVASALPTSDKTDSHQVSSAFVSDVGPLTASPTPTPMPTPVTGINHWWTYEEDALGGVGKYMINVGNGNLLVQADDMAIPNKGVELAFRRTYNSMSKHDYAGTDGSTPSNYGNGWTNTFDAHLGYNSGLGILSVYDIDGARYDYSSNGTGCWIPPAGQFATLCSDGASGYYWTKKTGTVYYFYGPVQTQNNQGFAGRLYEIFGRNQNNYLMFAYSFDSSQTSSTNLNKIVVTTEAGQAATLLFANFSGDRLLSSLTWPSGTSVAYYYDTAADPTEVDEPTNNSSGTLLKQQYAWVASHQLQQVSSPRYVANPSGSNSGSYYVFTYTNTRVTKVQYQGTINPVIGTIPNIPSPPPVGPIQPSPIPTGIINYRTVTVSYATTTQWGDSDAHQATYTYDGSGRVTQVSQVTGEGSGGVSSLTTTQAWDSSDNLISTTDARGNESDYAYDNNGNIIAVAEPSISVIYGGQPVNFRPTSLYSYDSNNNVIAYCDPVWSHTNGKDWTSRPGPSDSLCPTQTGTTQYTWTTQSYEPFGELTQSQTPLGYHRTFAYSASGQGGVDYGLPTSVQGDSINQNDGTTIQPQQTFTYDTYGNLICYGKEIGTTSSSKFGIWALKYDGNNRITEAADPDDGSSFSVSQCGKPSNTTKTATTTAYFANRQVSSNQTPSEAAASVSTTYTYDLDGNELTEVHHYGGTAASPPPGATTQKYYDAEDRLVEVALPHDSSDTNPYGWVTQYLYDLTQGGSVKIRGSSASFKAYGNLFSSQEWTGEMGQSSGWTALKGYAYDALDRTVTKYAYPPGYCQLPPGSCTAELQQVTYDASGMLGLLQQNCNAASQCTQRTYDAAGELTLDHFTDGVTPDRTYAYDADGRSAIVTSATFGNETRTYDSDGNETQYTDPTGGGVTSPATLTYHYYGDGSRSALDVASSGLSKTSLISYSYRADGLKETETLDYSSSQAMIFVYTPAGRKETQDDPYTGDLMGTTQSRYVATSYQYNTYGQVSAQTMPWGGQYTSFAYDPEGETVSYIGYSTSTKVNSTFTVRGELVSQTWNGGSPSLGNPTGQTIGQSNANGFEKNNCLGAIIQIGHTVVGNTCSNLSQSTFDPIAAALTKATLPNGGPEGCGSYDQYSFDAAGRLTQDTYVYYTLLSGACSGQTITTNYNRTYDAEDHTTLMSGQGGSYAIQYGPNGRPILWGVSGQSPYWTAHWDGDQPLFVTDKNGKLLDLKFDRWGFVGENSKGYFLYILDREVNGSATSAHYPQIQDSGYAAWLYPVHYNMGQGAQPSLPYCASCSWALPTVIDELSPEGVMISNLNFQGVRTYDPTTQQWTAPDPYQGDVNDPISQKSYVWNRNNPVSYSDPTGFHWQPIQDPTIQEAVDFMVAASPTFAQLWDFVDKVPEKYSITTNPTLENTYGWAGVFGLSGCTCIIMQAGLDNWDLINDLAHEVGHAYDYALCQNCFDTNAKAKLDPSQNPEGATTEEELQASMIHDVVMRELMSSGLFFYLESKTVAEAVNDIGPMNNWDIEGFENAIARL